MNLRLIGFLLVASIRLVRGQDVAPTAPPSFEVASIKASAPGARGTFIRYTPGTRAAIQNATVRLLIQAAFAVREFQITGGPAWINDDRYDVTAKGPDGAPQNQIVEMMRSLLADRFHLTFHRETRELPVYYLTAVKRGMKLVEPNEGSCTARGPGLTPELKPGQPPPNYCGTMRIGPRGMDGSKIGMQQLTVFFSDVLGRTVIDKTDFKGTFDVHLEFVRDQALAGGILGNAAPGGAGVPIPPADPDAPSIFTAAQEQLGLRLESAKGPVEVLVIDHVEKPTED